MNKKTVIIAGSSGLVGKEVVKQLLNDPMCKEMILLVRRSAQIQHEKVKEIMFDFSAQEYKLENIQPDAMFICIGTTMKIAKTKEAFKEVDLHIPVKLGKLAKTLGIADVSVISAMGANGKSAFFYNRVKGEMESQLIAMNFPHLTIVRPSLLIGEREEFRFGERFAEKLYCTLPFLYPKKYQPVEASAVARAIINENFKHEAQKLNIIENKRIHEISRNS